MINPIGMAQKPSDLTSKRATAKPKIDDAIYETASFSCRLADAVNTELASHGVCNTRRTNSRRSRVTSGWILPSVQALIISAPSYQSAAAIAMHNVDEPATSSLWILRSRSKDPLDSIIVRSGHKALFMAPTSWRIRLASVREITKTATAMPPKTEETTSTLPCTVRALLTIKRPNRTLDRSMLRKT